MVEPPNNRVFHYKPSILGYPYFWKHPCIIMYPLKPSIHVDCYLSIKVIFKREDLSRFQMGHGYGLYRAMVDVPRNISSHSILSQRGMKQKGLNFIFSYYPP